MGDFAWSSREQSSSENVGNESLAQEVSDEKDVSTWPRDHSCDILTKTVVAFESCLRSVPEAKLKSFWIHHFGKGNFETA